MTEQPPPETRTSWEVFFGRAEQALAQHKSDLLDDHLGLKLRGEAERQSAWRQLVVVAGFYPEHGRIVETIPPELFAELEKATQALQLGQRHLQRFQNAFPDDPFLLPAPVLAVLDTPNDKQLGAIIEKAQRFLKLKPPTKAAHRPRRPSRSVEYIRPLAEVYREATGGPVRLGNGFTHAFTAFVLRFAQITGRSESERAIAADMQRAYKADRLAFDETR